MPAISLNALIANLTPGRIPPAGPLAARVPDSPRQEQGVVFTRGEPWRNLAGLVRVGYSRQEAGGGTRDEAATSPSTAERQPDPAAGSRAPAPDQEDATKPEPATGEVKKPNGELLSKGEMALLRELQKADAAVKAHEMAHLAAAGGYARGGASFSYQRGPDGQNYAVGGEVQIDTGKERTPEATIVKMQVIRQAALAPVDPSPQDQRVAAHATLQIAEASKEMLQARPTPSRPGVTPPESAEGEEAAGSAGTARGVYQQAAPGVTGRSSAAGDSRQGYATYRTPTPAPARSDRQGLDRMV